jgi:rod shape determining protein RodA
LIDRTRAIVIRLLTTRAAWPVLVCVGLLCAASIFAIRLSSPERATRQEIHILLGIGVLIVALIPSYQFIGRGSLVFYILSMILLAGVLLTPGINGSRRWYPIGDSLFGGSGGGGFQLQPSELAKIAFVLMLARYLRYRKELNTFSDLLIPSVFMLIPFVLILVEPDHGTALLFPAVFFAMLIAAGIKLRYLATVCMIAIIAMAAYYPLMPAYARGRIFALTPTTQTSDPHLQRAAWHAQMSAIAIGSGGLTGDPDGVKHIKQGFLPESHTDFIFATIGAQFGFMGCAIVVLLYFAFFAAAADIAISTKEQFGRLLAVGLSCMILFQALINMCMTVQLAPIVGITLPFVSYGGSSLLTNMLAVGLLLNVSLRRQSKTGFHFGD